MLQTKTQGYYAKMKTLEEEAGALAPLALEDGSSEIDYKALYNILIEAYFASKDLNVLLQGNIPIIRDTSQEVLQNDFDDVSRELATVKANLTSKTQELEFYRDGAELDLADVNGNLSRAYKIISDIYNCIPTNVKEV